MNLLAVFTGDQDYNRIQLSPQERKKGVNMCTVADNLKRIGREEGLERGKMLEIFESVQCGDYSIERGAQKLQLTVDEFCEKMKEAGFIVPAVV